MSVRPMSTSRRKALGVSGLAVAATLMGAAVAPAPAAADDGDRTKTVACESLHVDDRNGNVHAKTRNCTVTWGKNIIDGAYWQTVKFQLLDARSDGVCGYANVIASDTGNSKRVKECNGVWTTRTASFSGRSSNIFIRVAYGDNSVYGNISTNVPRPSGF
ncbi:hypothetical protein [Streptomyces vastus]|uniref:Secreted protein n=1 Tax=Streptomyces vastus TaxID=285451 RepID=A0ABN3R094_9ACTN